jgi:hypothetical protein
MKSEIHFDASKIIKIVFSPETKAHFMWLPAEEKTFFFGLLKSSEKYPEGFYTSKDRKYSSFYTKKKLESYDYKIRDNEVFVKSIVSLIFENKVEPISKRFMSNEEALSWIEKVKILARKDFIKTQYE